jgi:hypothetical protein
LGKGNLQLGHSSTTSKIGKSFVLKRKIEFENKHMDEELKASIAGISLRLNAIEEEIRRYRQIQENPQGLAPRFVESSPNIRTYGGMIEDLISPRHGGMMSSVAGESFYIMGYFDHVLLDKLVRIAKQTKIISPCKELPNQKSTRKMEKNEDALERIAKMGAEVRVHPMLHARMFCNPQRRFLIIGSGDIQTHCFGGTRFDAGIYSNNLDLIKQAMDFYNRVWQESEPLTQNQ